MGVIENGMQEDSSVYFAFVGDKVEFSLITDALGIQPTCIQENRLNNKWLFEISIRSDLNIKSHIHSLIDVFESKIEIIKQLKVDLDLDTLLQLVIHIDTNPEVPTPYFPLNRRVIDFLNKTGSEVDFDLYKV